MGITSGIVEAITGSINYYNAESDIDQLLANTPDYQIPAEVKAMVDLYRKESQSTRLPGQDLYEEKIFGSTAQGLSSARETATSASDLLGAQTQLYGQQSSVLGDLQIAGAQRQQEQMNKYAQSLETLGQYQDKAWNWNVAMPWQQDLARAQKASDVGYETWQSGSEDIEFLGI